jgi:hypothetical protein
MSKQTDLNQPDLNQQCQHISPRGQRCRMLRASDQDFLCAHHVRQAATAQHHPKAFAAELLQSTGDLATPGEVNALLANVVKLLARRNIDRKDAVAFGYLSQLLLCSLPGMEKKLEAERDALALEEVNKSIAEMQTRYLAKRAASKAAEASQKSQNNPSTGTKDSSGPASQHAPSNTPTSTESGTPQPPRDYYSMRT